jgi:arsenate reductase-like glutaredoxin family protein
MVMIFFISVKLYVQKIANLLRRNHVEYHLHNILYGNISLKDVFKNIVWDLEMGVRLRRSLLYLNYY